MSEIEEIKSEYLGEHYYQTIHKSGLKIIVFPKDRATAFGIVTASFGSINNKIEKDGEILPDGIAHFLEHKMFANKDGEGSDVKFAKIGGYCNAFTTYNLTSYYYQCTENIYENLRILLKMVYEPYFTKKSVKKEIGIISQEIKMCNDEPDNNLVIGGLRCMYKNLPLFCDVAGTVESIKKITPELLYKCHKAGYSPSNMNLCVCGRVEPDKVIEIVDEILGNRENEHSRCYTVSESDEIVKNRVSCVMDVAKPLFCIFVKNRNIGKTAEERLRESIIYELMTEIYFGRSSDFCNMIYENGYSSNPSSQMSHSDVYSFFRFYGDTSNPEQMMELFEKYTSEIVKKAPDSEKLDFCRRIMCADYIRDFDVTEDIAVSISCDFAIDGTNIFDYLDILMSITPDDILEKARGLFNPDKYVLSTVMPKED